MRKRRLSRIITSNWEQIQRELDNGYFLVDVFRMIESKYQFERANATWYKAFAVASKKMDEENARIKSESNNEEKQPKDEDSKAKQEPITTEKSNYWSAKSDYSENPVLARLKREHNE